MSLTILSLLPIVLAEFVPAEELAVVLQAVGILGVWYGRYRIGDILPWGTRK